MCIIFNVSQFISVVLSKMEFILAVKNSRLVMGQYTIIIPLSNFRNDL